VVSYRERESGGAGLIHIQNEKDGVKSAHQPYFNKFSTTIFDPMVFIYFQNNFFIIF
jgi:hypothetical protein